MTIVNEIWRIVRSVAIIHYFFFIFCKITFDVHDTRGNKDERTLKVLKLLNYYQNLEVTGSGQIMKTDGKEVTKTTNGRKVKSFLFQF